MSAQPSTNSRENGDALASELAPSVEPTALAPTHRASVPMEHPRRCSKRRSDGEPCHKWALRGTDPPVCTSHGAAAPQVRAKAELRLQEARELALVELADAAPEAARNLRSISNKGKNEAARVAASRVILDHVVQDDDAGNSDVRELLIRVRERVSRGTS